MLFILINREITYFFRRISCFPDFQEMILDDKLFLKLFEYHKTFNLMSVLNCILVLGNLSENEDFQFKLLNNKAPNLKISAILTRISKQVKKFRNIKMTCQTLRILANFSMNPAYHTFLISMDLLHWVFQEISHRHYFTTSETFTYLLTVLSNLSSTEYFHKLYYER